MSARQGILPFVMRHRDGDDVTARAGLPLVVEAMRAVRLDQVVEQTMHVAKRSGGFSDVEKLEALVLLLAAGGDRVEDVRLLSDDRGLERLLDRTLPSPDALLDFLAAFDDEAPGSPPEGEASWVRPEGESLRALAEVNRVLVERAATSTTPVATIDHDGTIIESARRGAQLTYEGTRGFQPLVAVWAEQDLIVADEFRDGNVPAGKDPLSSVQRAFQTLPPWVRRRYFRGDSADYYLPLLKYLVAEEIGFSISADMGRELRAACVSRPAAAWRQLEQRACEDVHLAEVEFASAHWPKSARPLRYVGIRFTPRQGELLEPRGPKYLAVVTNRPTTEISAADLVRWHWGKAGTIEHVHRALKDELGAGVLPSSRYGANAAWFRVNTLTYNVLTLLRRCALPDRYRVARPKRLRFECFTLPGKLVEHQRQLSVNISASRERVQELATARERLLALRAA